MGPFLNLFLSVIVGVVLNVVSVNLYRSYIRERRENAKAYARVTFNHSQNQTTTNNELDIQVVVVSPPHKSMKLSRKEVDENKAESNMFRMALTLCSLSILSRILIILIYIYLLFFTNLFSVILYVILIFVLIYTLIPSISIFVFYSFNKMFREELRKKSFIKKTSELIQVRD
jgi:hypothetical protein